MEIFLIICAAIAFLIGLIGCVAPGIPGVPIAYAGMLLAHFSGYAHFSVACLVGWGAATIALTVLDFIVPAWGTRKFGGTRWGVWGSVIGLLAGMFLGLPGIVLGPFLGAFVFEAVHGAETGTAMRAAFGSFIGLLIGTVAKLICCGVMLYLTIRELL